MISAILQALENGLNVMKGNSRLLLVAILVFIFPLLFLWVTQGFFETSYDNIRTSEKQRVGMLHDSIAGILTLPESASTTISGLIKKFVDENQDVTKVRVSEYETERFKILYSDDPDLINTYEESDQLLRSLPLDGANNPFIYEAFLNNTRTSQAFWKVEANGKQLYIFSEHSYGLIDSVMAARKQKSYLALSSIFVFLIALAWWLNKQIYWESEHGKLKNTLDEQSTFTSVITHEFRSPLTAIKGYAELLKESDNLSEQEKNFAETITLSAHRLVVLVGDFLEVASIQAGKIKIEKKKTNIADLLEQTVTELTPLAAGKNLELLSSITTEDVFFNTDPLRFTQVITNITSNSIKYTDTGSVELQLDKKGSKMIITIKDTGTGISAEDQKKLFGKFSRVGGVEKSNITGTGLGMWITKELVTLLGGRIGVESIRGVGTHVVITFKQ